MYRKRNQITEMMICLVDALVVVFCLTLAGMMRYQTFEELAGAENSKRTVQYYTGVAYSKLLFPEGIQWILQARPI